jgi:hypothetical protein
VNSYTTTWRDNFGICPKSGANEGNLDGDSQSQDLPDAYDVHLVVRNLVIRNPLAVTPCAFALF